MADLPKKFSQDWWRSDAAYEDRCALYVGALLMRKEDALVQVAQHGAPQPTWPAIQFYDVGDDSLKWVYCDSLTQLRDYLRPEGNVANAAALALLKTKEPV